MEAEQHPHRWGWGARGITARGVAWDLELASVLQQVQSLYSGLTLCGAQPVWGPSTG